MITLRQLEYFCKLAETEHVSRTAKQLFISQTALSSMIKGLENELGVQLFDRTARAVHLNAAGTLYLKYVTDALQTLDLGREALNSYSETMEKEISLAVGSSLVWGPLLHDFQRAFPQCLVKQKAMSRDDLEMVLRSKEIDFVIAGSDDIRIPELECRHVRNDNVYLCVPEYHYLAQKEFVYLEEIKEEPFISLPQGTPWQIYCDNLFKTAGLSIKSVLECDYTLRAALIESGFGIALTSSAAKEVDLLHPNRYIQIKNEFAHREMAIFWNPKRYMSKASRAFLEFCTNYYE